MSQIANYVAGSRTDVMARIFNTCKSFQETIGGKPSAEEYDRNIKVRDAEINFEVLRLGG
jgi:predicted metallopeptidase